MNTTPTKPSNHRAIAAGGALAVIAAAACIVVVRAAIDLWPTSASDPAAALVQTVPASPAVTVTLPEQPAAATVDKAPDEFTERELAAIARDQRRRDHDRPDPAARPDAPSRQLPNGAGALANALPLEGDGWRMTLLGVSPRRGVYLVLVTAADGSGSSLTAARAALRVAALRRGDDPAGYDAVVPMSALGDAHRRGESRRERGGRR